MFLNNNNNNKIKKESLIKLCVLTKRSVSGYFISLYIYIWVTINY